MRFVQIILFLFCIISSQQTFAQQPALDRNTKEGEELREWNKRRNEQLIKSAGTPNLSLVNYREFNKIKDQQAAELRMSGITGYTPLNGSWTQINMSQSVLGMGRINCFAIDPSNSNIIYAGTPTGGLWKTTDAGNTWTNLTTAIQVPGISGICVNPNNTNMIYILTGSASSVECQSLGVFKSVDGGQNWLTTGFDTTFQTNWFGTAMNAHKLAMDPQDPNILYAAMTTGLFRTSDAGATWSKVYNFDTRDIEFHPTNSNVVYATFGGGYVAISIDNGVTFPSTIQIPAPAGSFFRSCTMGVSAAAPDSVFFAVTTSETASGVSLDSVFIVRAKYNSFTGGVSGFNVRKCFCPTAPEGYISSALRWYRDARIAVSPTNTADIYIGGLWVYASSNYGVNWIMKSNNTFGVGVVHSDCTATKIINGTFYTTNDGGFWKQPVNTTSGTSGWTNLTGAMPIAQIYKIGISQVNTTDFTLALQDNGCHYRSNVAYDQLNGGDGLMARMSPTNTSTYYFRVNNFVTVRARGGVATNINPIGGTGYTFIPFEVSQSTSTTIYTAYKDLYVSTTEGDSWLMKTVPGSRNTKCMAISKSNANAIWLLEDFQNAQSGADSAMSVLRRTLNGGTSFQTITLPATIPMNLISSIVVSPEDENRVYITVDGYNAAAKVFFSTNAANANPALVTWTNLQSSTLPNLPVLCLAYESSIDHSIYIGTEMGVYYYNTGINKWIPYNNGLPICRVNELQINYSALKLIAATYGRGIFISDFYANCNLTLNLSGNQSGNLTYSAVTNLTSSANLIGGVASQIKYYAEQDIFLSPGFTMAPGTNFIATIADCGGIIDPYLNRHNTSDSVKRIDSVQKIIPKPIIQSTPNSSPQPTQEDLIKQSAILNKEH
ncbi:MAG: 3-coathanger stack domain-containing protein [Ferruginibacter sp.]